LNITLPHCALLLLQEAARQQQAQEQEILAASRGGGGGGGRPPSSRGVSSRVQFGQVAAGGGAARTSTASGAAGIELVRASPRFSPQSNEASQRVIGRSESFNDATVAPTAGAGLAYAATRNPLAASRSTRRLLGGSLGSELEQRGTGGGGSPLLRAAVRTAQRSASRGMSADGLDLEATSAPDGASSPRGASPVARKSSRGPSGDDDAALLPAGDV
jgi:hypothetical protein